MKFRRVRPRRLHGRNVNTVFKTWMGTTEELKKLRKPRLTLQDADGCCSQWISDQPKQQRYLVMGKKGENNDLTATFLLPWSKSKVCVSRDRVPCVRLYQYVSRDVPLCRVKPPCF